MNNKLSGPVLSVIEVSIQANRSKNRAETIEAVPNHTADDKQRIRSVTLHNENAGHTDLFAYIDGGRQLKTSFIPIEQPKRVMVGAPVPVFGCRKRAIRKRNFPRLIELNFSPFH